MVNQPQPASQCWWDELRQERRDELRIFAIPASHMEHFKTYLDTHQQAVLVVMPTEAEPERLEVVFDYPKLTWPDAQKWLELARWAGQPLRAWPDPLATLTEEEKDQQEIQESLLIPFRPYSKH